MNEFIEKLIGRLEEEKQACHINAEVYTERKIGKIIEIVNELAEEHKEEPWVDYETVRSNRVDCEVPSDYFDKIKEVWVIDEWTEETKVFKEAEEYNGCWIPCSERLPKGEKEVLIFADDNSIFIGHLLDDGFSVYDGEGWIGLKHILAWQRLPEPYKEG